MLNFLHVNIYQLVWETHHNSSHHTYNNFLFLWLWVLSCWFLLVLIFFFCKWHFYQHIAQNNSIIQKKKKKNKKIRPYSPIYSRTIKPNNVFLVSPWWLFIVEYDINVSTACCISWHCILIYCRALECTTNVVYASICLSVVMIVVV